MCPLPSRETAWKRLASDLDRTKLSEITSEIGLDEVIGMGGKFLPVGFVAGSW